MTWQLGLQLTCLALVVLWAVTEGRAILRMRRRARMREALARYTTEVDAQWTRYLLWLKQQRCRGCGAQWSMRQREQPPWFTETWCGCDEGRDKPDDRPEWSVFGRDMK